MEPNLDNKYTGNNSEFNNKNNIQKDSLSQQKHFLSLRKNKRLNLQMKRFETQKPTEKYKLNQNSYDPSNEIIKNFFNIQNKSDFLSKLISSITSSNIDNNLSKFILVQCLNYYDSQKGNPEKVIIFEEFFSEPIISNLIEMMHIFKNDYSIVYTTCYLLFELTYLSSQITKFITLTISNIQKIFNCLNDSNEETNSMVLCLLYNCYIEDDDKVNENCNIGLYVLGKLNNYSLNIKNNLKNINSDENLKILISLLGILINKKTSHVYKTMDIQVRNNIIHLLLILCNNAFEEDLKLESHNALKQMLKIVDEENINVDKFGLCNIINIFLPHIKLETNSPEIVEISMEIIETFSFLCDVEVLLNNELFEQFEKMLIDFNDMNTNKSNPKSFYLNYKKKDINKLLIYLVNTLSNSITLNKFEKYIMNETNIIKNLILALKIIDLENETIINIFDFFNEFIQNKDNCIKIICDNFIDIGILFVLNRNLNGKNYDVVQSILNICFLMLKKCSEIMNIKANIMKYYLEKKGFNEILNLIIGSDYGNNNCSEIAKNIQSSFF